MRDAIDGLLLRFVLRPLGVLFRSDRWEPHFVLRSHCPDCGAEETSVIAARTHLYDPETDACYGLECGTCGERRATTLGVMGSILRAETDPAIYKTMRSDEAE